MFKCHTFDENNLSLMTHAQCHKANKYHASFTVSKTYPSKNKPMCIW